MIKRALNTEKTSRDKDDPIADMAMVPFLPNDVSTRYDAIYNTFILVCIYMSITLLTTEPGIPARE
jgi:hypothetical protein